MPRLKTTSKCGTTPKPAEQRVRTEALYEMFEHPIFNKYFEELERGSLKNELTTCAFYEPTVALKKRACASRCGRMPT